MASNAASSFYVPNNRNYGAWCGKSAMAVFVEAGRGRRKWEARKSISGAVRGSPGRAVQAGIRGIELTWLVAS